MNKKYVIQDIKGDYFAFYIDSPFGKMPAFEKDINEAKIFNDKSLAERHAKAIIGKNKVLTI